MISTQSEVAPGVHVLRGLLDGRLAEAELAAILTSAPLRQMTVPGGRQMSVRTTNAGPLGWTSDRTGYRYSPVDPLTGEPWPPLPPHLTAAAQAAAMICLGEGFVPDACLINRYAVGTQMGMHRDTDEASYDHPIVSLSLGLTARFVLGGLERGGRTQVIELHHGDTMVFGGPARLRYHGVRALKEGDGTHAFRTNLTFRMAGSHEGANNERDGRI
jgi:alkylated DNA repair protein (DNA oxidative demethylase)